MLNFFLLIATIAALVISESFNNYFGKKVVKCNSDITKLTFVSSIFSIIVFVIMGFSMGGLQIPTLYTVIMGSIFGIVLSAYQLILYRAYAIGSFAYTTLFSFCGMVIPASTGSLFFNQPPVDVFQVIGVVLMLIMFYITANPKKNENVSIKWLLLAILIFFLNGAFGVVQQATHFFLPEGEQLQNVEFLIISFALFTIVSFVMAAKEEKDAAKVFKINKITIILAVIIGISVAFNHIINLYLAGAMDSIIFYPVANGAGIILCTLISALIFKEKYTKKQYFGLALGIVAILLLSDVMANFINI